MARVALVISDGFEEIEAVTVIDVLRRAHVEVLVTALQGETVLGGHDIRLHTDTTIDQVRIEDLDAVVLPGGAPSARTLRDDGRVIALLQGAAAANKMVAAICAAPIALERAGLLQGRRATSYPGFEPASAQYLTERVVEDGNIITSRGPGTAFEFALLLVARLVDAARAAELRQAMLFPG